MVLGMQKKTNSILEKFEQKLEKYSKFMVFGGNEVGILFAIKNNKF